jgi:hypothetical protein
MITNPNLRYLTSHGLAHKAGVHRDVPSRLLIAGIIAADALLERDGHPPSPLFSPERVTQVVRNAPRAGRVLQPQVHPVADVENT